MRGPRFAFIVIGTAALAVAAILPAQSGRPVSTTGTTAVSGERILRFIREKFGVAESVKMTIEPLHAFTRPEFLQATVTIDDGKQKRTQDVYVMRDQRYLIVGKVFVLGSDPKREIVAHVRETFKVPEANEVTVGPYRRSNIPALFATSITADDGKQKQTSDFYVTKDGKALVLGSVFNLGVDPRQEAARTISTRDQPSVGPANAPVTIVEYADLQCPRCAQVHQFIEKDLLPKYGEKIRIVFKEFPLVNVHDWSLTAAVANQCAYQINPSAFLPFRRLIYERQSSFNAANVRDTLIQYGEQAGLDRLQLAACIDSKASLPRVEENFHEGQALNVASTPTFFINGRILVGGAPPQDFYKIVDEVLAGAK